MKEICGQTQYERSGWYDPNTRCWRTSQASLYQDTSVEFSGTWPRAGTMQGGVFYRLPNWERRIREIDCLSLEPTPNATMGFLGMRENYKTYLRVKNHGNTRKSGAKIGVSQAWCSQTMEDYEKVGGELNPEYQEWLMGFPLNWTAIEPMPKEDINDWQEKFGTQAGAEDMGGGDMRHLWWGQDPSEAPQGRQPMEQQRGERGDPVPEVSHGHPHGNRNMGPGEEPQRQEMPSMRGDVSSGKGQEQTVQEKGMSCGMGTQIGRTALGVKDRVNRLKAIGNAQVPAVVRTAWELLTEGGVR